MSPIDFSGWLHGRKDATVSFLLEKALQHRLAPYGRLIAFKLDTRRNSAQLELHLKGENEPVTVWVEEYALESGVQEPRVLIKGARASREWITILLEEFVIGKAFPLPEKYAGLARKLL